MSQSMNSNADSDVMIIDDVPAASSAQGTFVVPIGPIRANIARGRSNQAPQGRSFPYPLPRARGTTNPQTRGASQRANRQPTFVDHHSPGMVSYNYAAIQAAQIRHAQEEEMKRRCEEGQTRCRQEVLKLKPMIAEVQGRVDGYNRKFEEDIEKDKVLLKDYKKGLGEHSEKLQSSVKKEHQELDEKVAVTANQEALKKDLKEFERLQKLRRMLAEDPHFEEPAPESKAHDAKQLRQTMNKFGFGIKMTEDLEEYRKGIAAFSKTEEQNVKEAENEIATSFENAVEIFSSLGHKLAGISDLTPWLFNVKGLTVIPQIVMTAPKNGEEVHETLRKERPGKSPWTDLTSRDKDGWNRRAGYIQAFQADQEVRGLVFPMSAVVKEMGEIMAERMREEEEDTV